MFIFVTYILNPDAASQRTEEFWSLTEQHRSSSKCRLIQKKQPKRQEVQQVDVVNEESEDEAQVRMS